MGQRHNTLLHRKEREMIMHTYDALNNETLENLKSNFVRTVIKANSVINLLQVILSTAVIDVNTIEGRLTIEERVFC